jgi:hypothetical protein
VLEVALGHGGGVEVVHAAHCPVRQNDVK